MMAYLRSVISTGSPSARKSCADTRERSGTSVWTDTCEAIRVIKVEHGRQLLTTWIHVPVGCLGILTLAWLLDLLMDRAPFDFPGSVLGCILLFALLLLLDYLSTKFPGTNESDNSDIEKTVTEESATCTLAPRKRFVDPLMATIAPPYDFLLRNMNLLFTPAFISIPAREVLPARDIARITAWFSATQVLGFVVPVLLCKLLRAAERELGRVRRRKERTAEQKVVSTSPSSTQGDLEATKDVSTTTSPPTKPDLWIAEASTETASPPSSIGMSSPDHASKDTGTSDRGRWQDDEPTVEVHDGQGSERARPTSPSPSLSTPERLAQRILFSITPLFYTGMFIIGLCLWFTKDVALPLHLSINVLTYWLGMTFVPLRFRRFAHPILTTSIGTCLLIWAFGEVKGYGIRKSLSYYSRNAKFDVVWDPLGYEGPLFGAADILSSLLDAGIIALCIPLYRYRHDLRECGVRMTLLLLPCVGCSFFLWPTIGSLIGLDQPRALAFAARFLSTPLAIELIKVLQGDESITVVLVVTTGIVAAILKEPFFRLMRVDVDDHLTIGVTFGSTSGAIGASSLMARPRVMALASLGFILYGTLCLAAAAIPPLVQTVQSLAMVKAH